MTNTDEQIRDGLARLTSALTPPPDATERVALRIAQRRRTRRAGIAACGLAVIAATGVAVVVMVGDSEVTGTVAVDPAGPGGSLVLTRPDGSTYSFGEITVECVNDEGMPAPGDTGEDILASSAFRMGDSGLLEPFFYMKVDRRELEVGRTYDAALPENAFVVFAADAGTSDGANEVSSNEPGTAGTVRVLQASCEPVPTLQVELDATLGSEVDQEPMHVAGTLN